MRLAITAPTYWRKNAQILGQSEKEFLGNVKKVVEIAAPMKFEIAVVPHKKSLSEFFAIKYKKLGGRVIGIVPLQDKEFGVEYLNREICDKIVDCGDWRNQPEKLNEASDAMLCLGFGAGTLNEIAMSKWFNPDKKKRKRIIVVREFISAELPEEAVKDLDVVYVQMKGLGKALKELGK